jgi:tetratricopeptide (TPR) repeat protein
MFVYIIVVFSIVLITSALLLLVFNKIRLLNYRTVLAIALSSVLSGLLFPGLFNLISGSRPGGADIPTLLFVMLSIVVLYILLAFVLGVIISFVIPGGAFKAAVADNTAAGRLQEPEREEAAVGNTSREEGGVNNLLEEIYSIHAVENGSEDANNGDNVIKTENYLEKSVDSAENIDKMGLENLEQGEAMLEDVAENSGFIEETTHPITEGLPEEDGLKAAENLSVNDCVDEAFRLKELGDFEGAILYYMYALDRKPDKDLIFWIVLDICVLYKNLGQIDFAQEILSGYVDGYSDVMDSSVREEIERNLLYIQD